MTKITRKSVEAALAFGLICAIFLSAARFNSVCDDLRSNVLRLHIIANSDSEADQEVKLKIRDAILEKTGNLFSQSTDLEDAENTAEGALCEFEKIANEILSQNGLDYKAEAKVGNAFFETREYEDFTLPAGNYRSLIINLGKGEGKNWWCVIFPAVCIPAAGRAELSDSVNEKSAGIAENPQKYILKFKTVEIYEKIKKSINK